MDGPPPAASTRTTPGRRTVPKSGLGLRRARRAARARCRIASRSWLSSASHTWQGRRRMASCSIISARSSFTENAAKCECRSRVHECRGNASLGEPFDELRRRQQSPRRRGAGGRSKAKPPYLRRRCLAHPTPFKRGWSVSDALPAATRSRGNAGIVPRGPCLGRGRIRKGLPAEAGQTSALFKTAHRSPWTKEDVRELKAHSKARTPVSKIAKSLKRSEGAIRQKALAIGIGSGHRR